MNAAKLKAPHRITKVLAYRDPARFLPDDIQIYVRVIDDFDTGRRVSHPATLTLVTATESEFMPPLLSLNEAEAQRLMDSLWECGVRPGAHTSAGQLEQCETHLADLRVIAFHKLGITAAEVAAIGGKQAR